MVKGTDILEFKIKGTGFEYAKEFLPIVGETFRSDFYIPELNLLIEFEGINSHKSRHTGLKGYSKDCEKYNLYSLAGYKLLRYTILTTHNFEEDIKRLINELVLKRELNPKKICKKSTK